jgi:hypothetical protein
MRGGRVRGLEAKRVDLEGDNERGLSLRGRCPGGGVGERGWSGRRRLKRVGGVEAEGGGVGGGELEGENERGLSQSGRSREGGV